MLNPGWLKPKFNQRTMNIPSESPANDAERHRSSPYRFLFFDLDHTLWDFEANSRQALEALYRSSNLQERGISDFGGFHRAYLVHNDKLWERYRNGYIGVEELRWKRMWLTLLDYRIADEALAKELGRVFLDLLPLGKQLFPYTHEILHYLRERGYQLHLITNGFEKTQQRKLQHADMEGYFGQLITSEVSQSLKPHREIFDYALKKTGAVKEESIMIGDSIEVDILGAMNAGIDQVYVNHLRQETNIRPTYTVFSLRELEDIF
jgi:putative hydrolase of the HAD superfamily